MHLGVERALGITQECMDRYFVVVPIICLNRYVFDLILSETTHLAMHTWQVQYNIICEARRKTYFRRYEEAAELMPRSVVSLPRH